MMKPELRKKLLTDLSRNNYGLALTEHISEEIGKLSDITRLTPENVESNRSAVIKLREIFKFLHRLKDNQEEKSKNQYQ